MECDTFLTEKVRRGAKRNEERKELLKKYGFIELIIRQVE